MKIGLCGGIANNMYVFAQAMVRHGHDVMFIRDRGGLFGFSQPVWEDARFTLGYDELWNTYQWNWAQWTEWEQRLGWEPPKWLADPFDHPSAEPLAVTSVWSRLDTDLLNRIAHGYAHWQATVSLMRQCDALLVCGIEPEILALASGRPFGIWTHGGDLRTAAGMHPPQSRRWPDWKYYLMRQRLLRLAFKRALWIGSYDPGGLGGHIGRMPRRFKITRLPIPIQMHTRAAKEDRRRLLARVLGEVGQPVPSAEHIIFVPSRVDFFWKGLDRFLGAVARIGENPRLHIIVSGWGRDYERAREMVPAGMVTFLPCALSKPILFDFFRSVDVVVDQFLMGGYGTSAIEAMSCGTPVLMWFDNAPLLAVGWEPPPVLNAHTEEEIARVLRGILAGTIDLEASGRAVHDWVARIHGEDAVVPVLAERFRNALGAGPV